MEFKIKKDDYNHLLKRKEVYVEVSHENQGSPSRSALRDAVASKYGAKPENVYVVDVHTRTGTQESVCKVQVYDDAASAKQVVPEHLQIRNLPVEERKKAREQKAKKREEKPKAEAPAKKEMKPKEEAKAQPKEAKETKEVKEAPAKEAAKQPSKEGRVK